MKQWHKFKFILHPSEFEDIFKGLEYFFPITNTRVPIDYEITDKTSIISKYEAYYNKIVSGTEWTKDDWKLIIYSSITDNKALVEYESFEIEEDGKMNKYKRPIILQPVINISPFNLMVDPKDRLSVMYSDPRRLSYIGIEFAYRTTYRDPKSNEFIPTNDLSTYHLFQQLIASIKSKSGKAKAQRNGKLSRPNFWISKRCIPEINNNVMMKKNKILLI